jgi:uncharacterized protein
VASADTKAWDTPGPADIISPTACGVTGAIRRLTREAPLPAQETFLPRMTSNAFDEQHATLDFLSRGEAYGLPGETVERLKTHAAFVFLVGDRAYKVKRAVRYSFLDFSSLEKRRQVIETELKLNRLTAPELYRRVLPVTREDGGRLALEGSGPPVEWLLEMKRFDQSALLDNVAARGGLEDVLLERLADELVAFHRAADVRKDRGGLAGIRAVVEGNAQDLGSLAGELLPEDRVTALNDRTLAELERHRALLEERRRGGRVSHCHGDLHLGNIVLIGNRPVLFDRLEFDEALACTDRLYDLAFLLMDLCHRGLKPEAQRLLSNYQEIEPDDAGLALLPLFQSCRAAIRAKTQGFGARLAEDDDRAGPMQASRAYLDLALELLGPPGPRLVAIGGLSGTGKSSLARELAPELGASPGALVLRSDRLRKRLLGAKPTERLGPDAYAPEATARVYDEIGRRAATILSAGHSVIADAVFADEAERDAIEASAKRSGAAFCGLWLEAPVDEMERRIEGRSRDASDATVEVLRRQQKYDLGRITWRRIEAGDGLTAVAARARATIRI